MRGKKKLVLGIAVMSTTGMLVFTAQFPQQQIMQTEGTFQLTTNETAGATAKSILDDQLDEILTQAVTVEKHDSVIVSASASEKNSEGSDKKGSKNSGSKNSESKNSDKKGSKNSKSKNSKSENRAVEKNKTKDSQAEINVDKKSDATDSKQKSSNKKNSDSKNLESKKSDNKDSKDSNKKNSNNKDSKNKDSKKNSNGKNPNKSNSSAKETAKESAALNINKKKNSDQSNRGVISSIKEDSAPVGKESGEQDDVDKKWSNKLMAEVDDYLNVREADSKDSEVVGKLRKGDVATVLEKGNVWTKIKSGSVKGYVKNKFCIYGKKAYKLANKICGTYATVQTDGLRIRKNANKNATILEAAEEGDQLVVNTKAKEKDGWVAVKYNDKNAFVAEKYVDVALVTGKAISIEEELEQIAAQKQAEEAAQAAESPAVSVSSNQVVVQEQAPQVSTSDLTLLSAIIYCEAGGESYAGQVAVGAVVMNRVKSGLYPNSISGVVYQSGQFSPVANGSLARALSNGAYQNCTAAAQEALAGADNTGGAKFFHRVNGDAGLVIGNHVFY